MAPRTLLSALLFGAALLPSFYQLARAEDDEDMVDDSVDLDADEFGEEEGGQPGGDQADLWAQVAQMKELMEKGGDVDPEMKAKLAEQLDKMGGGGGAAAAPLDPKDAMAGCFALSTQKAGVKSPKTMTALKQLADGITREEGGKVEIARMVAVCLEDVTSADIAAQKSGSLLELPRGIYNKAITSDGRKSVKATSDEIWAEMSKAAKTAIKELTADLNPVKKSSGGSTMGLLALVPVALVVGFMIKRLLDMQKENETKKSSSGKKDKKKKQ